jgi:hypothetical protein
MSMSERSRQELRKWREEYGQIEEEQRIEAERPLRQAEAEWQRTATELAKLRRDVLLEDQDPTYTYGANPWEYATLPQSVKNGLAVDEWRAFLKSYPEFHPSTYNFEQLRAYLVSNHCTDMPVRTDWATAYEKLNSAGLLEPIPVPVLVEKPAPAPKHNGYILSETGKPTRQSRYYTPAEQDEMPSDTLKKTIVQYEIDHLPKPQAGKPQMIKGRDPETGLEMELSPLQVKRLPADEYRKFVSLSAEDRDLRHVLRRPND